MLCQVVELTFSNSVAPPCLSCRCLARPSAAPLASSNYKNTISSMKRLIGRKFDEPDVAAEMAWVPGVTFVKMPDGFIGVTVNYNDDLTTFSITQVVARCSLPSCWCCSASARRLATRDC